MENNIRIINAAVKRNDQVITGRTHSECIYKAIAGNNWDHPITQEEQGFVDNNGKFHDRIESMKIAVIAGQLELSLLSNRNYLISEDLRRMMI